MTVFKMVRSKLSKALEIPEDALGGAYRMQMIGNSVILSACRKILKYKSEEIAVLTKETVVTFEGEHLKCIYFFEGTLEISGDIRSIGFDKK